MSRVGSVPVPIPSGVTVDISDTLLKVKGPKGELSQFLLPEVKLSKEGETVVVSRINDEKISRSRHGLMRSLLANMIQGVNEGFQKKLEVEGVGFKVNLSGNTLKLALGYSHEIEYVAPDSIELAVDGNTITVSGIDKQQVGQIAAEIRALKKPEPYKGKGIRYEDEQILRKAGKAAAGGEAA